MMQLMRWCRGDAVAEVVLRWCAQVVVYRIGFKAQNTVHHACQFQLHRMCAVHGHVWFSAF